MKIEAGVYRIEHASTGRVYIGSSCHLTKRWQSHVRMLRAGTHHSSKLQRAWNKHGEQAFSFVVLESVAVAAQLKDAEQRWIESACPHYNTSPFANRPPGRSGPHTEATKDKIRSKRAAQIITPEAVAKQRAACTGQVRTAEQRARIAAGCVGRKHSAETKAKIAALRTGTTIDADTRARMSAAQLGRVHTDEAKSRISAARKGIKLTDESIQKRQATRRANAERQQGAEGAAS